MTYFDLQRALKAKGFNPGPIDGIPGPMTRGAIMDFQGANGLTVDGIVDHRTLSALVGEDTSEKASNDSLPTQMPWLSEAHRLVGTKEDSTKRQKDGQEIANNSPIIMNWADQLDVGYSSDEVAWCGLFVGHCVGSMLPNEPLPSNILGARQWMNFGKSVTPQLGSVLVFWRTSIDSWKGHVGFYWGEDTTHYHVLGGNQSNAVNVKRLPKSRLLQALWPKSVAAPNIKRHADPTGVLRSVTEA